MLILIAESKTMAPCNGIVSHDYYQSHCPALENDADSVMASLRDMTADQLTEKAKISLPMVRKLQQMAYEFPNKALGGNAIEAFTGVVFKAFDYRSLDEVTRLQTDGCVRIISSLYGWLRPADIVKPYRLDFTTPLAPDGRTFASYLQPKVTACLLEELKGGDHEDVLNLLPGDAARCIDWKAVGSCAKVWKADFQELLPGGKMRTPNSNKLKTLRGELLRQIVSDRITSASGLLSLQGNNYISTDTPAPDGTIEFHTFG